MYQIDKTFEDVKRNNEGLIKKLVHNLKRQTKYCRCTDEELYGLVLTSAWQSWLYQQKQAVNGVAKYTIGTYLTRNIKRIAKLWYKELAYESNPIDEKRLSSIEDKNYFDIQEREEYVENLISHLPENEASIIRLRYFQDETLMEVSEKLGKSKERIRQIENISLEKLKKIGVARNA